MQGVFIGSLSEWDSLYLHVTSLGARPKLQPQDNGSRFFCFYSTLYCSKESGFQAFHVSLIKTFNTKTCLCETYCTTSYSEERRHAGARQGLQILFLAAVFGVVEFEVHSSHLIPLLFS